MNARRGLLALLLIGLCGTPVRAQFFYPQNYGFRSPYGGGFSPYGGGFSPYGGGFSPYGGGFSPYGGYAPSSTTYYYSSPSFVIPPSSYQRPIDPQPRARTNFAPAIAFRQPPELAQKANAYIDVKVPTKDTVLKINDQDTKQMGETERSFVVPDITPGAAVLPYDLAATWTEDGKSRTKRMATKIMHAGGHYRVDFTEEAGPATPPPTTPKTTETQVTIKVSVPVKDAVLTIDNVLRKEDEGKLERVVVVKSFLPTTFQGRTYSIQVEWMENNQKRACPARVEYIPAGDTKSVAFTKDCK